MKTAVEQLMIALYEGGYLKGNGNEMDDILEKYKKVFKQQLEKTFDDAVESEILGKKITAEEYYNEKYGSKGSVFLEGYEQIDQNNPVTKGSTALVNKKEQKKLITEIMEEDAKDGLYNTSSQTEISDQEYYKDVFYQKQVMNPYPTGDQSYTAYEKGFMDFAKWYREQLKQK